MAETSPTPGPVHCSGWLSGGRTTERPKCLRHRKHLRGIARQTVNLNAAQNAIALEDEDATQRTLLTKHKVPNWVNTRCRLRETINTKVNARTTTRAPPWRDLRTFELRQERLCFGLAMLKHPTGQVPLGIRELSVAVGHQEPSRITQNRSVAGAGRKTRLAARPERPRRRGRSTAAGGYPADSDRQPNLPR